MFLRRLHVQNFRNIALARLEFEGARGFFLGPNGQGKTNLLEAAGFFGTLRSFRGAEARDLIRHGETEARILCVLEHEREAETQVEIIIRPQRREVLVNGARCQRLADFLGRFPTVALSSHDLQLLRGGPQLRRRAFDLALSSLDENYFLALRRYHEALEGRNSLLRGLRVASPVEFASFENIMAEEAGKVLAARTASCATLASHLATAYAKLVDRAPETPGFVYQPESAVATPDDWRKLWDSGRVRDLGAKTTLHGPHRDDFVFQLIGKGAKEFASEGQQRALVVALRLGQAAWQREKTGIAPLLLADDVLGELDPRRREGFWRAAAEAGQVLATGTTLPTGEIIPWTVWNVRAGEFTRE
jgi:DNA replication and repair protein RecF